MHGLIYRAIQCFLRDSFGAAVWHDIAAETGVPADGFEPMLRYDDAIAGRMIDAAAARLDRSRDSLLEDLGTYLVSHPNREGLRRLLRFGGVTFLDFLHSIDDLPGRGRLAVPDLDLPQLELRDHGEGRFSLVCRSQFTGFVPVMVGVLRAMADDYGALVLLEAAPPGRAEGRDTRAHVDPTADIAAEGDIETARTTTTSAAGHPPGELSRSAPEAETIAITLFDPSHGSGRSFELAAGAP